MRQNDFLDTINRHSGMTVPEGYFNDFARRMSASLPEQPWEKEETTHDKPRTMWQTIRPYVYMAAMFMGVWCMMQMMDNIIPSRVDLSVDGNPLLTEAVSNDAFINEYFIDDMETGEIYEELWDSGMQPADYTIETAASSDSSETDIQDI